MVEQCLTYWSVESRIFQVLQNIATEGGVVEHGVRSPVLSPSLGDHVPGPEPPHVHEAEHVSGRLAGEKLQVCVFGDSVERRETELAGHSEAEEEAECVERSQGALQCQRKFLAARLARDDVSLAGEVNLGALGDRGLEDLPGKHPPFADVV